MTGNMHIFVLVTTLRPVRGRNLLFGGVCMDSVYSSCRFDVDLLFNDYMCIADSATRLKCALELQIFDCSII